MASILSEAYGEGACLYTEVLEVSRDASPSQLRKAYYKKCLRYHPDKQTSHDESELAEAKRKFQAISLAYTILSNEEKRREYDESGDLYEEDDDLASSKSGVKQWTDYFDSIFPKVTTADIDAFEVKYKCSDEEEKDVLKYYSQFKGDLNKMLECVMLSSDVDKERWVKDYIEPAIQSGDVENYEAKIKKTLGSSHPKKRKAKGRSKKKKVEQVEMEEESDTPMAEIVESEGEDSADAKENNSNRSKNKSASLGKASAKKKPSSAKASRPSKKKDSSSADDDLIAAIRGKSLARREAGFDSLMAGLEDRYGGGKKKKGKKKQKQDDIDDDEFAKIQEKLMKNKTS
mmetsp:Transcript_22371/g.48147  ORF Transcript_22371/g.48147 Transcript_22371/m.48147 type:complete len:345 (+) Transcript_22371:87-1121(+)